MAKELTVSGSFRTSYSFVSRIDFMDLSAFAQSFSSAVYRVAFIFCAAAMNNASYRLCFGIWQCALLRILILLWG